MELIQINNVTKDYRNNRGIFNLNIEIEKGTVHGLVGTNGSGKTTTMRHIMGFLKSDSGNILVNGLDSWNDAMEIKKNIGYIPGEIDFPDVGTGNDFLKLQAEFLGMKDLTYMNELINLFKLDTKAELKRMSKGMKQKTAIIVAFMNNPDIIIMDEPSTGLDPLMRDTLIELILEYKQTGKTIFMSSHIFKELEDTCDKVTFIKDGRVCGEVDRSMFSTTIEKLFNIDLLNIENWEKVDEVFKVVSEDKSLCQKTIVVEESDYNEFFQKLEPFNVMSLSQVPYTLEYYYNEVILKQEEI